VTNTVAYWSHLYVEEKMEVCKYCPGPQKIGAPGKFGHCRSTQSYYKPNFVEEKEENNDFEKQKFY
jgi:hypothetical protein